VYRFVPDRDGVVVVGAAVVGTISALVDSDGTDHRHTNDHFMIITRANCAAVKQLKME